MTVYQSTWRRITEDLVFNYAVVRTSELSISFFYVTFFVVFCDFFWIAYYVIFFITYLQNKLNIKFGRCK